MTGENITQMLNHTHFKTNAPNDPKLTLNTKYQRYPESQISLGFDRPIILIELQFVYWEKCTELPPNNPEHWVKGTLYILWRHSCVLVGRRVEAVGGPFRLGGLSSVG